MYRKPIKKAPCDNVMKVLTFVVYGFANLPWRLNAGQSENQRIAIPKPSTRHAPQGFSFSEAHRTLLQLQKIELRTIKLQGGCFETPNCGYQVKTKKHNGPMRSAVPAIGSSLSHRLNTGFFCLQRREMDVEPKIGGKPQKWMVQIMVPNPMNKWTIWGKPTIFGNTQIWNREEMTKSKNAWKMTTSSFLSGSISNPKIPSPIGAKLFFESFNKSLPGQPGHHTIYGQRHTQQRGYKHFETAGLQPAAILKGNS